MPIYWSILFISVMMLLLENAVINPNDRIQNSASFVQTERWVTLATFLPLLFFLSFRDFVLDTYAYVEMFNITPGNWNDLKEFTKIPSLNSVAFFYSIGIFKILFSTNHYWWFCFMAAIGLWCIYKTCLSKTPSMALTVFLFISGTTFTWLLNGMRQFFVVCLLFYASQLLLKDKKIWFIFIVFILSYFHRSAIFLIPIVFFTSKEKILGKGMIIVVLATLIGTYFSDFMLGEANELMGGDYGDSLNREDAGTSIMRLLVTCVTPAIALINLKKLRSNNTPPYIILAINMSIVGACFMFVASFTNGILIGRMPAYFTIYNLYLLPWLIYNCFSGIRPVVVFTCVSLYIVYFYVQMCIAWHGLPYVSYALGLNYWGV